MQRWIPLALAALAGTACTSPPPHIPFPDKSAWHASAFTGAWDVSEFVTNAYVVGVEGVFELAGTQGWGMEYAFRYASGSGDDRRLARDPTFTGNQQPPFNTAVDSDVDADFYELSFGVRQTYRGLTMLQPWFGVGGAIQYFQTEETWIQPATMDTSSGGQPMFPVDTGQIDHERGEYVPAFYVQTGFNVNVLRDQVREYTEFPITVGIRWLIGADYHYGEIRLGFGFGR